jgi:hypothetical protein
VAQARGEVTVAAIEHTLDEAIEELKSKGVVSMSVSDGTVFMFSRAVIQELHQKLAENPNQDFLTLFITKKEKARAINNQKANA